MMRAMPPIVRQLMKLRRYSPTRIARAQTLD